MDEYLIHYNHNHDAFGRFLDHLLESERKTYHHWAGKFSNRKANRYAKKLQKRIGDEPIGNLNSKQLYAGRKYCMRFVD